MEARIEEGVVYSPYPGGAVPNISVYEAIKACLERGGKKTALVCADQQVTSSELLRMLQRYAAGFQRHGVKPGDKVLAHLGDSVENFIALYAIIIAGGVAILSDPASDKDEAIQKLRDGKASHVLTTQEEAHLFARPAQGGRIKTFFGFCDEPGFVSVSNFKYMKEAEFVEVPVIDTQKDLIALAFTSGTTGGRKAVEETHYGCVAGLQPCRLSMMFDQTETVGTVFSLALPVGFRMILRVICSGATCVMIPEEMDFDQVVNTVKRHQITTLFADTTTVHQLAIKMSESGVRLPSVRHILLVAVKATEKAANEILSVFSLQSFRSMYGSTEFGNVISWMPQNTIEYKTVGFPAPNAKIKIVDIGTGQVLGPNQKGELWVKSPTIMSGYHDNPESTRDVITHDGWLRSGDVAYYDETGRLYMVERIKQFFHCMERQVAESEIEAALLAHESVADAAVIGIPHPEYIDVGKAFVVLKPSQDGHARPSARDMQEFVAGQLPFYKQLHGGVLFVESIPRNSLKKIDKRRLKLCSKDSNNWGTFIGSIHVNQPDTAIVSQ